MFKNIIKFVFPSKCIFCNEVLDIENDLGCCESCYKQIVFLPDKIYSTEYFCKYIDGVICACRYEGKIREAVQRYKFFDKPQYYRAFGKLLADRMKNITEVQTIDLIIPVPLHKDRYKQRGYNQSELICDEVASVLNKKVVSQLLKRVKNTESQSSLGKKDRIENIRNAFSVKPDKKEEINGRDILLVDDILTTGSTLDECSKTLKLSGAKKVISAVIATGRKFY